MQMTLFPEKNIELFCPSCENEQNFNAHPKFKVWVCVECGFSISIEFRDENNTWDIPEPSRSGGGVPV